MSSSTNISRSSQSAIASYEKSLDHFLGQFPTMLKIERKVGIPKARLVAGLGVVILGYGILQIAANMLIASIIFGYPAFMTMKAIESGQKSEHALWLAYWVSLAVLQLLESFSGGAIGRFVPLYQVIKIAFHLWLCLPMTQVTFSSVICHLFLSNILGISNGL